MAALYTPNAIQPQRLVALPIQRGVPPGPDAKPKPIRLIPYAHRANRGGGEVTVWMSWEDYAVGDVGPAGGYIFYVNPSYRVDDM